jgi:hypothetical protein
MNKLQKAVAIASVLTLIPSCASYKCITLGGIIPAEEMSIKERVIKVIPAQTDTSIIYLNFRKDNINPHMTKDPDYREVRWDFMRTE